MASALTSGSLSVSSTPRGREPDSPAVSDTLFPTERRRLRAGPGSPHAGGSAPHTPGLAHPLAPQLSEPPARRVGMRLQRAGSPRPPRVSRAALQYVYI